MCVCVCVCVCVCACVCVCVCVYTIMHSYTAFCLYQKPLTRLAIFKLCSLGLLHCDPILAAYVHMYIYTCMYK